MKKVALITGITDQDGAYLAELIQSIIGHRGKIYWDSKKLDGTPRKLMDSSKFHNSGWNPLISLNDGIKQVYNSYKNSIKDSES